MSTATRFLQSILSLYGMGDRGTFGRRRSPSMIDLTGQDWRSRRV